MKQGMKMFEMAIDLLIFLSVISSGLLVKSAVDPIATVISQQSQQRAVALEESQYSPYDSHIVSGSSLTTAVDRYSNNPAFYVYVQKISPATSNFGIVEGGIGTSCPSFNYTTGKLSYSSTTTCAVTSSNLSDSAHSSYVLPQARFKSTLVKDNNQRVVGIYFQEQ
jgi:hypothetical protein